MRGLKKLSHVAAWAASIAVLAMAAPAIAQDSCANRGQLDTRYCDADNDLVADAPTDPRRWRDPSTFVWAFSPVEDAAVYANLFKPFTDHLEVCTGKRVVYHPVQSNSAQIEAMRSGRLHFAGFAAGAVGFAVNLAGAVPFAAMGQNNAVSGYHLISIVRSNSNFRTLADLKGRRVAHTSPSSNSGNLAPRVLFAEEGLKAGEDYTPLMSGGHDRSVLGVASGDYDMAAVASDVFERMIRRGTVKAEDFRVIYKSKIFPAVGYSHAHDLKPDLAKKLKECFYSFSFPETMKKEFNGDDRFLPISYKVDWETVRSVAERSGTPYNRAAYEAESRREAEAAARRQQQQATPPAAAPTAPAQR